MKTIVLDDDPTGTQSASRVDVLLETAPEALREVLASADAVYVQTNSRAIDERSAVELVSRLRDTAAAALAELGERGMVVLRGDSTLRGHVFAETDALAGPDSIILFAPAFPAGGRVTVGGVHYVEEAGGRVPVGETEYARDPVFPFRSSRLTDYVAEKSDRPSVAAPLSAVRGGGLADLLGTVAPRTVVVPDIESDGDVVRVAHAVLEVVERGRDVVVRCAAPLAAELGGVRSEALLTDPLTPPDALTLVVCGSHTDGAARQLDALQEMTGARVVIDTERAFQDPARTVAAAVAEVRMRLARDRVAVVATERERRADHGTLADGDRIMSVLVDVVREVVSEVELVISKGGITAAEVAARGIGAVQARVLGQLEPGVSVWAMSDRADRIVHQVIVPGNVGGPQTMVRCLERARGRARMGKRART